MREECIVESQSIDVQLESCDTCESRVIDTAVMSLHTLHSLELSTSIEDDFTADTECTPVDSHNVDSNESSMSTVTSSSSSSSSGDNNRCDLSFHSDTDSGRRETVETVSKPVFDSSLCTVDQKHDECHDTASVSRTANISVDGDCVAVANQSVSTASAVCVARSSQAVMLTACLTEVSCPVEETATHIGTTHIHVADQLTVVNGVVQSVDSPVKIGEYIMLFILSHLLPFHCTSTVSKTSCFDLFHLLRLLLIDVNTASVVNFQFVV